MIKISIDLWFSDAISNKWMCVQLANVYLFATKKFCSWSKSGMFEEGKFYIKTKAEIEYSKKYFKYLIHHF